MREDLAGKRFGYLTVLGMKQNGKTRKSWTCKCDCGKVIVLGESRLLRTKNRRPDKSCGCMQLKYNGNSVKHYPLYQVWNSMVRRCYDDTMDNYERYGAKGVEVSSEWRNDFNTFLEWALNNGYKKGLTLDRTDGNKGYSPYNCRWVTYYVQEQNKDISNRNTTGHVGVTFTEGRGYRSYISRNGKRKNLGSFNNLEDAIKARGKAEEHYEKYGTLQNL